MAVKRLTLEIVAGTSIDAASVTAQGIADASRVEVLFEFNGIECVARPGGSAQLLATRQQEEQLRKPRVFSGDPA